jgi:hypothetical protein
MKRPMVLKQAAQVFCRGMMTGYVVGAPTTPSHMIPGWKGYEYREDDFRLADIYTVSQSGPSVGQTHLYYQGSLIWFMSYGGFYKKEAIPALKAALASTYSRSEFNLGRGPLVYRHENYEYILTPGDKQGFSRFSARERIVRIDKEAPDPHDAPDSTPMGEHEVWGMALV